MFMHPLTQCRKGGMAMVAVKAQIVASRGDSGLYGHVHEQLLRSVTQFETVSLKV